MPLPVHRHRLVRAFTSQAVTPSLSARADRPPPPIQQPMQAKENQMYVGLPRPLPRSQCFSLLPRTFRYPLPALPCLPADRLGLLLCQAMEKCRVSDAATSAWNACTRPIAAPAVCGTRTTSSRWPPTLPSCRNRLTCYQETWAPFATRPPISRRTITHNSRRRSSKAPLQPTGTATPSAPCRYHPPP